MNRTSRSVHCSGRSPDTCTSPGGSARRRDGLRSRRKSRAASCAWRVPRGVRGGNEIDGVGSAIGSAFCRFWNELAQKPVDGENRVLKSVALETLKVADELLTSIQ